MHLGYERDRSIRAGGDAHSCRTRLLGKDKWHRRDRLRNERKSAKRKYARTWRTKKKKGTEEGEKQLS